MSDAQTILKMIEEVDPADAAKLFEIDKAVALYLYPECAEMISCAIRHEVARFCTSRDALKAVRPDGWEWYMSQNGTKNLWLFGCAADSIGSNQMQSPMIPTEELAELHAIIQAIEFERGQK